MKKLDTTDSDRAQPLLGDDPDAHKASVASFYGTRYEKSTADLDSFDGIMKDFTHSQDEYIRSLYDKIHPDISAKDYGCGCPIPIGSSLAGHTVLDLGSGSGRDCFVLSKLVSDSGRVIGIDLGESAIELASKFKEYHREIFGLANDVVDFRQGDIADLSSAGVGDSSVDLVVSNCVINLAPDKKVVYKDIDRVLKPGGEFFISDVYLNVPFPPRLQKNKDLVSGCASGAMVLSDFSEMATDLGFELFVSEFKLLVEIQKDEPERMLQTIKALNMNSHGFYTAAEEADIRLGLEEMTETIRLYSITVRGVKMQQEEYQSKKNVVTVVYRGNEKVFPLDLARLKFEKDVEIEVSGDLACVLARYPEFEILQSEVKEEDQEERQFLTHPDFEALVVSQDKKTKSGFLDFAIDLVHATTEKRVSVLVFGLLLLQLYFPSMYLATFLLIDFVCRRVVGRPSLSLLYGIWKSSPFVRKYPTFLKPEARLDWQAIAMAVVVCLLCLVASGMWGFSGTVNEVLCGIGMVVSALKWFR